MQSNECEPKKRPTPDYFAGRDDEPRAAGDRDVAKIDEEDDDVTIKELRAECPEWSWVAKRVGFGWEYRGRRGTRSVDIRANAVIVGPAEDDCATQWRVYYGVTSCSYAAWWVLEYAV